MEIVERAVRGLPVLEASSLELDREGPSYTVDTLTEVGRLYPGAELVLLVGADAFADMGTWRDAGRIFELARVVVVDRADHPPPQAPQLEGLSDDVIARCLRDRVTMEPVAVSSTEVRERVAAGRSLAGFVPDAVAAYIEERGLYRSDR
jgi:nicotinate-nucleotide adenylyltransferase